MAAVLEELVDELQVLRSGGGLPHVIVVHPVVIAIPDVLGVL